MPIRPLEKILGMPRGATSGQMFSSTRLNLEKSTRGDGGLKWNVKSNLLILRRWRGHIYSQLHPHVSLWLHSQWEKQNIKHQESHNCICMSSWNEHQSIHWGFVANPERFQWNKLEKGERRVLGCMKTRQECSYEETLAGVSGRARPWDGLYFAFHNFYTRHFPLVTQKSAVLQLRVGRVVNLLHSFVCIGSRSAHSTAAAVYRGRPRWGTTHRTHWLHTSHITHCCEKIAHSLFEERDYSVGMVSIAS